MYTRAYPSHHRIIVKFHRSHGVNRMQNHAENPVNIFSVYLDLSIATSPAFKVLIWMRPESPNIELPRQRANDHRTIAWCCQAINTKRRSLSYTSTPVCVCGLHEKCGALTCHVPQPITFPVILYLSHSVTVFF